MRGRNGRKLTQSIKPKKKKNKKGHTQAKARETVEAVEAVEAVEVIEDVMGEELIEGETALLRAGTNPATCTNVGTRTHSTYMFDVPPAPPHPTPPRHPQ